MEHRSQAMFSACVATSAVLSIALSGCGGGGATPHTYDFIIDMCDSSGCRPSAKRVALDTADNPTKGDFVTVSGDSLTLEYKENVGGPRVYLIEKDGTNENFMFDLVGKEFSFDVELSTMTCGFNAALYFVGMDKNEGGAESGSKYCDAQAVGGTFCSEMDIFEGNTAANVFTTHGCIDQCASYSESSDCQSASVPATNSICDHDGCGINPFRHGPDSSHNVDFYGQSSNFAIDTSQSFTVTTQFHDNQIERFYTQNGHQIDVPTLYVMPNDGPFVSPKITDEYCGWTYDSWTGDAELTPTGQMFNNFRNGMVLTMSAWYDKETYANGATGGGGMSWMDGNNSWGQVGPCHTTTSDSGSHQATFSKIRFGDINTTTPTEDAAPAPAAQPSPHGVLV